MAVRCFTGRLHQQVFTATDGYCFHALSNLRRVSCTIFRRLSPPMVITNVVSTLSGVYPRSFMSHSLWSFQRSSGQIIVALVGCSGPPSTGLCCKRNSTCLGALISSSPRLAIRCTQIPVPIHCARHMVAGYGIQVCLLLLLVGRLICTPCTLGIQSGV